MSKSQASAPSTKKPMLKRAITTHVLSISTTSLFYLPHLEREIKREIKTEM